MRKMFPFFAPMTLKIAFKMCPGMELMEPVLKKNGAQKGKKNLSTLNKQSFPLVVYIFFEKK